MTRVRRYLLIGMTAMYGAVVQAEVPEMYQVVAAQNGVPAKLFFALMLNESRTQVNSVTGKKALPWPWTINHRGKPYFFPNKEAAFLFARDLVVRGDKMFDVGLGQVNWFWHEKRFRGLWEAFDPFTNLTAAARHFREQYERPECNTWTKAVGCYHRPGQRPADKEIASAYTGRVLALWKNI